MIAPKYQHTSSYMGSSSTPIVFAEIIPIVLVANENERYSKERSSQLPNQENDGQNTFPLTSFGVKQFLLRKTRQNNAIAMSGGESGHQFFIRWKEDDLSDRISYLSSGYFLQSKGEDLHSSIDGSTEPTNFPLVYIPSENPTILECQPCCIIAYAHRNHINSTGAKTLGNSLVDCTMCHISQDTLIRILPPQLATKSRSRLTAAAFSSADFRRESMLYDMIGEEGRNKMSDERIDELIQNHNEETIRELTLKMSAAIASIKIGTTRDAFLIEEQQRKQMRKIEQSLRLFSMSTSKKDNAVKFKNEDSIGVKSWPSLIVHSPNHGDGKTLLVQALAKRLEYSSIHLIQSGALLAKYSTRADSALESQLHAILITAACRNEKVCIILDQLDMMLPARLSGRSNAGDAATPVFNSIMSYLRKITDSMQRKREFPFPLKNPLYNPTGCDGTSGQVLDVKFCLVGIVTCPDDGWKSNRQSQSGSTDGGSSILDSMIGDRYRLPLLKAKTILSAFRVAFAREGMSLEDNAEARLAAIASSAPWAKGSVFRRVAKQVKWALVEESVCRKGQHLPRNTATLQDLEQALALVNASEARFSKIEGQRKDPALGERKESSSSHFGSVGGNESAKVSLEDALAFDPKKRYILSKFGLSPPTGVLLYGPPGCGKTLLAKAVAKLFENPVAGTVSTGGTFISLSISEIVSSEVGTSEKTIAASFEFAEKNAPSVIFLDEFQALFTDRSRGGSGKLTTTLLQCLDDIKRWYEIDQSMNSKQSSPPEKEKRIVVIAATNTPWMIDSAFLRSGRFDRVVHVGLPSLLERKSILRVHIGKMRLRGGENSDSIDKLCEELSVLTEGFSGADIAALCRAAAVRAFGEEISVEGYHFKDALKFDVFPSSDESLVTRLRMWRP